MSLPENEQPVTRAHFDESLKSIHDHMSQLAARLERAETTLLSGFHSYARREGVRSQAAGNTTSRSRTAPATH